MAVKIQFRRGTSSEWTSANPTLSAGEFGFETDTRMFKIGNGSSAWDSLTYAASGTITGVTAGSGLTGGGIGGVVTLALDTTNLVQNAIVDAKGDIVIGTASDTVGRLGVGTDNQRLIADSAQTAGLRWASDTEQPLVDAKGDLIVGTADNTVARLGVGANNSIVVADSSQTTGVKWASNVTGLTLTNCTVDGTNKLGTVNIPVTGSEKTASYTLTTSDIGKYVQIGLGGSVIVPNSTFAQGDAVTLVNNSTTDITVTLSTTNAYVSGINTNKTSVTLRTRGIATVLFLSGTSCLVSGNVL